MWSTKLVEWSYSQGVEYWCGTSRTEERPENSDHIGKRKST